MDQEKRISTAFSPILMLGTRLFQRCLITGAGGFVGRHLLEYFERTNDAPSEILGIDYHAADIEFTAKRLSCRFISLDLTNQEQFAALIAEFQPDCLIHLAAVSNVAASWQNPAACISNNVSILLNVFEAVRTLVPKCRILAVGSSEVYDPKPDDSLPLDETQPLRPTNPYAVGRLAQENLVQIYVEAYGLDIVSTRSFSHTGPGQSSRFVVPSFVRQLLEAKRSGKKTATLKTGNVDLIRDFSDVRDVVRAYHLLLKKGRTGEIYNVCRGEGISLRNIIKRVSEILELETAIEVDPARLRPTDSPRVVGCSEKFCRETGWTPQFPFEKTLQDMILETSKNEIENTNRTNIYEQTKMLQ